MNTKIILTVITSLIATAAYASDPPAVGSAAPDFSVTDAKGKTHALSQYKGKYVVLEWFNPQCPFVKKHYGGGKMQKMEEQYKSKGGVWFVVDFNAPRPEGDLTPGETGKNTTEW